MRAIALPLLAVFIGTASLANASLFFPPPVFRTPTIRSLLFDDFFPSTVSIDIPRITNDECRMTKQENETQLVLTMDLPGLGREEIQVSVKDDPDHRHPSNKLLTVEASHKCPETDDWWCRERNVKQTYRLDGPTLDLDSARVQHRDGVLRILINKKQPLKQEPTIRILPVEGSGESAKASPKLTVQQ